MLKRPGSPLLKDLWLSGCAGCEMALIGAFEGFFQLLKEVKGVSFPLIQDIDPIKETSGPVVTIVTGAVAFEHNLYELKKAREESQILVAIGTCATHGGIPAMLNRTGPETAVKEVFGDTAPHGTPLPSRPLDRIKAVDEVISPDLLLPGCPPSSKQMVSCLKMALRERPQRPGGRQMSVCDECSFVRLGHFEKKKIVRFLPGNIPEEIVIEKEEGPRCLLEQGFLCLGPVTLSGCGDGSAPLCLKAGCPCKGCYGPAPGTKNQLLALLTILSTHGISLDTIQDTTGVNRFSGGHGTIRAVAGAE